MENQRPSILISLIPILILIGLLTLNVTIFGDAALDGSNQMVLIFSAAVAAVLAIRMGTPWETLREGILDSISSAMIPLLILLMIGALAGTWMASGIVPAMIYYGLKILNPTIFLFAACIICIIVSLATGSSWTTAATVGIALLGIGKAMGIGEGMIAGAILSGAYFGDKMSPLSDTTNLAPAMAGTDLFTHIRYMTITTLPSISITLILFFILGFTQHGDTNAVADVAPIMTAITDQFYISPILFIVPLITVLMILKNVPPLPVLFMGTLLGGVLAGITQPQVIQVIAGEVAAPWQMYYKGVMKAMYGKIEISTSNPMVNELLTTSGMSGMLGTIWLIISAMVFGGVMDKSGMLKRLADVIIQFATSTGSLVASTVGTCVFFNLTASDQYLAIVVPGRMYKDVYKDRGLAPENLSRTLEDSGTVTSVLVPWNTCGAYHSTVLGVSTLSYLPFCFFNIISPIMTIVFAYLNIKIKRLVEA